MWLRKLDHLLEAFKMRTDVSHTVIGGLFVGLLVGVMRLSVFMRGVDIYLLWKEHQMDQSRCTHSHSTLISQSPAPNCPDISFQIAMAKLLYALHFCKRRCNRFT